MPQNALASDNECAFTTALNALKVELTKLPSLPPRMEATPEASAERALAKDIYESAVLYMSSKGDDAGFDRNFALLMPYYLEKELRTATATTATATTSSSSRSSSGSDKEPLLWGLRLLTYLVQNRIADFHATVELLPPGLTSTPEVSQVMELEGWMMQGSYAKVGEAQNGAVSPYYVPLLQRIVTTARNEIASCSQAAYQSLTSADAASILGVSEKDLVQICDEQGWEMAGGRVILQKKGDDDVSRAISNEQVIDNCLQYAKELERIL